MALVVTGTVVPMAPDAEARDVRRVGVAGRRRAGGGGHPRRRPGAGRASPSRPHLDVGDALVHHPGFVDLHSHLGYNTLPLWAEPTQLTPFLHHDIWPGEADLRARRRLAGVDAARPGAGVRCWPTSRSGRWPAARRPSRAGPGQPPADQPAGALRRRRSRRAARRPGRWCRRSRSSRADLGARRSESCRAGDLRLPLRRGSARHTGGVEEFDDARPGRLPPTGPGRHPRQRPRRLALRALAAGRRPARRASPPAPSCGRRSPTSGCTASRPTCPTALDARLGGEPRHRLGTVGHQEPARRDQGGAALERPPGWDLTDHDLVRMVTSAPGDVLGRAWQMPVGPAGAGGPGRRHRRRPPSARRVAQRGHGPGARRALFVAVGGRARYGTKALMDAAGERRDHVGAGRAVLRAGCRWCAPTTRRGVDVARRDGPARCRAGRPPRSPAERTRRPAAGRAGAAAPAVARRRPRRHAGHRRLASTCRAPAAGAAGPPPAGRTVDIPPIEPLTTTGVAGDDRRSGLPRRCPRRPARLLPMSSEEVGWPTATRSSARRRPASCSGTCTQPRATDRADRRAPRRRRCVGGDGRAPASRPTAHAGANAGPHRARARRRHLRHAGRGAVHPPAAEAGRCTPPTRCSGCACCASGSASSTTWPSTTSWRSILTELRDAHTRYVGPSSLDGQGGHAAVPRRGVRDAARPRYIVSKVADRPRAHRRRRLRARRRAALVERRARSTGPSTSTPSGRPAAGPTAGGPGPSSR